MNNRAQIIRTQVANHLENILTNPQLPKLGNVQEGKVRNSYSIPTSKGNLRIMIASDRVSAFDVILNRAIPFKGVVLNAIANHSFVQLQNYIEIANLHSPHPRITIQQEITNIGVECVMRGYIWGSLANEYEQGKREKCGHMLPNDLLRYQQLAKPLFTPTTKAEHGHDQDITLKEMARVMHDKLNGNGHNWYDYAQSIQNTAQDLYHRGAHNAQKTGLILLDTKYEFGINKNDPDQKIVLIDEVHTPDSSRYVEQREWENKFPQIEAQMQTGKYSNVTALLKDQPQLKIKEWSKQLVRDVLIEQGYDGTSGKPPTLTDQQVIETSARYIEVYERLTGKEFDFEYFSQPFNETEITEYIKKL